ncbi:MAG: ABC transporter permease [Alphaproteobacteria bacterium]|jgi:peptide/nickel transport system permease protein|nr:ABC transporter permease [Alphaproteobacteria bacterium]MDP6829682.1 ABC transporter permease [Alphaproteobacteria bacterium]
MAEQATAGPGPNERPAPPQTTLQRIWDSDVFYSFRSSKVTMVAAAVTAVIFFMAIFAPWVAPHQPFDVATVDLMDAELPPSWEAEGDPRFLIGTDNLGRDLWSTILYGTRISLTVGFLSVIFGLLVGVGLGLVSGYVGGYVDAFIMRVAEIQLSIPGILIALLLAGILRGVLSAEAYNDAVVWVLVLTIGTSIWPQFARTVRGSTLVERNKEYVLAARVIGLSRFSIMLRHVLPNVMGPVLVIATINLAIAILSEATLSFLGVGVPPTEPSLGTLINEGQNYLFSGLWWITIFPGAVLAILVLAVNLLGDWLRDALNPKLR